MKTAVIVLAFMAVIGAGINEHESGDPVDHHTVAVEPSCLMTALGVKLCDADARSWCETVSRETIIGTGDDTYIRRTHSDPRTQAACVSVGWTN